MSSHPSVTASSSFFIGFEPVAGQVSWAWFLNVVDADTTRLVSRVRLRMGFQAAAARLRPGTRPPLVPDGTQNAARHQASCRGPPAGHDSCARSSPLARRSTRGRAGQTDPQSACKAGSGGDAGQRQHRRCRPLRGEQGASEMAHAYRSASPGLNRTARRSGICITTIARMRVPISAIGMLMGGKANSTCSLNTFSASATRP
jgi:hypothetical protein